jgi:HAMP domain-containing protein
LKRGRRWWWIGGAALVGLAAITAGVLPDSQLTEALFVFSLLWVIATGFLLAWKLWRWMTYRIGVRLFITYLMIGVLPLFFATAFGMVGLYIAMGQYTSVRIGSELERVGWGLTEACEAILEAAADHGVEASRDRLVEHVADPPEPISGVLWDARIGGEEFVFAEGFEIPELSWLPEGTSRFMALDGETVFSVTASKAVSGDRVVALIPFDEKTSGDINAHWWFDVAFLGMEGASREGNESASGEGDEVRIEATGGGGINFTVDGEQASGDDLWPQWTEEDRGLLSRPYVVWFRVVVDLVALDSGESLKDRHQLALLRTSPRNVWSDFTLSRYELATELWSVIAALGIFFFVCYGLAMATSATMILSITRSTSRLSAGARAVERGDLDHRVPVKRHDQLGDLARSFNHMTDSVQSMLADVAEKERLARELELAREIQESLLPARQLVLGPVTVRATFRPATEVGGDYFDVFSLSEDRLLVAIGDVAGHGLSTGLLMASLKSSVAALVYEGYSGADLIQKVNHLLLAHGHGRTMVTLLLVDFDLGEGRLKLANAGHCPPFLVRTKGEPEELMASSLPMGSRLCRPATLDRPFPDNCSLVLYSDGLVEAISPAGDPFGYERLGELLAASGDGTGPDLTGRLLDALAEHAAGTPAADDLTILVVERS